MHYVIETDAGYFLFASKEDAKNSKWIAYEEPLPVPEGEHYRGTPPKNGVLFTDCDQSSRVFAVMLNARR